MKSKPQRSNSDGAIAYILSNQLPLISKADLCQIMIYRGNSQRQIDKAIKRLKSLGLVQVAYRNAKHLNCNPRQLPDDKPSDELIRSICEVRVDNLDATPTQVFSATARLAGLGGKNAVGDLGTNLLECYLRLGRAWVWMLNKGIPCVDNLEALWPSRNSDSRVAYARFKPDSTKSVNLAAAQPKDYREAKRWLDSLIRLGGTYVLC